MTDLNVGVFCSEDFEGIPDDMPNVNDDEMPQYGVPGRIIFDVYPTTDEYDMEVEVVDYDGDTSVYWLNEGIGISYWLEHDSGFKFEEMSGKYIVTVNGRYIKGQDWRQSPEPYDDDEEWWVVKEPEPTTLESLM